MDVLSTSLPPMKTYPEQGMCDGLRGAKDPARRTFTDSFAPSAPAGPSRWMTVLRRCARCGLMDSARNH